MSRIEQMKKFTEEKYKRDINKTKPAEVKKPETKIKRTKKKRK